MAVAPTPTFVTATFPEKYDPDKDDRGRQQGGHQYDQKGFPPIRT
jgi:hypothetical protein